MPKANALLQNIADIILRLVEYMEGLEAIIYDGIDCDIPARPKRTVAPFAQARNERKADASKETSKRTRLDV